MSPSDYSSGLISTTRLQASLCMFSGVAAVLKFEATTVTGRMLIIPALIVAFIGQLFVLRAGKPEPGAWVIALLPLFWLGLIVVAILWLVALS